MNNRLSDAQIASQIRAKIAAMKAALTSTRMETPDAQVGNLAGIAAAWDAGKTYDRGELFTYDGKLGFARQIVTASEIYPPFSTGTEALYGVRPAPDANGIYPYVYNMRTEVGMLVRENGVVYKCIGAADPLLYAPSAVPALFEVWEG